MKKYIITIVISTLIACTSNVCNAQNDLGKTDDFERIAIDVIVPWQVEGIPDHAQSLLESRLMKIAAQAGLGGEGITSRFALTAKMEVLTKNITPTAPVMHAYTFDVYFYIVDNFEQIILSATSFEVKGVGPNRNKAYTNALRQVNFENASMERFLAKGKQKIIRYYNNKCDIIIANAKAQASQKQYMNAIYTLTSVPEVCQECYLKSLDAIGPIYQNYINHECASFLNIATALFAVNPNTEGALQAAELISLIDPDSDCFKEATDLISKIETKMRSDEQREWNFKERVWGDGVDLERQKIDAYRSVGMAFGQNQQPTSNDIMWLFDKYNR